MVGVGWFRMGQLATPIFSTRGSRINFSQLLTLQRELLVYGLALFVKVRQCVVWVCAQKVKAWPLELDGKRFCMHMQQLH